MEFRPPTRVSLKHQRCCTVVAVLTLHEERTQRRTST